MTTNTTPWTRRVTAGLFLVAAPALIALGTASTSHADAGTPPVRTSPSYSPAPRASLPGNASSWHQWHQAEQLAKYR
jgi:hypothetical protein